ncbi:Na+/H+ antiporter NhaA [Erythrobacter sp. EC-HK427]|uniref:Na+/H+ antiporter NhaA n=1 Tax=Erythrobacter sp. EC-HK427 TaxID=2038396 RepID=UPI00125A6DAC|nr:Na+/H+ antiporter NhaA [Erythrobacter sp. EC-HK427]VVS98234.1 Na(+)/H(+) antiporter NhaA 1 [Erythrobacter sp. EC-HK427]
MAQPNFLVSTVRNFKTLFKADAFSGILLIAVAIVAMVVANSGAAAAYFGLFESSLFGWEFWEQVPGNTDKLMYLDTIKGWVNDVLMVVFFFVVGLEVKREIIAGNLSDPKARNLPIIAAIAGMVAPMGVYYLVSGGEPQYIAGLAIPAATDIAFAMGVVGLLGTRVPSALRLFLLTVAIVDDIGAVTIIAVFYSDPKFMWLLGSLGVLLAMYVLGRAGVSSKLPFIVLTVTLWYLVLNSGVHATIAGVLAAFMIPFRCKNGSTMLEDMEHALVPWNSYVVVPIFGFANAGVSLAGLGLSALTDTLPLAIAAGLVIGKQVGIFAAVWAAVKLKVVEKPANSSWPEIWGVSVLCGIGFTMSLFIGELAFPGAAEEMRFLRDEAKIGILTGSLISAILGYTILRMTTSHPDEKDDPNDPVV